MRKLIFIALFIITSTFACGQETTQNIDKLNIVKVEFTLEVDHLSEVDLEDLKKSLDLLSELHSGKELNLVVTITNNSDETELQNNGFRVSVENTSEEADEAVRKVYSKIEKIVLTAREN